MANDTDTPIIWLTDAQSQDTQRFGNKAANLSKLSAFGYLIPHGFCIAADIPIAEVMPSIRKALQTLPSPWAIRSSSTAEDGKGLAFPGIFTTILGSTSIESATSAITEVLASKDTPTVRRYAEQNSVNPHDIKMAVIVQRLILATCSGVAFSQNPVTGKPGVSIEANWGLGETLVDGSITPDYFEVAQDGQITTHRIGTKKEKAVLQNDKLIRITTTESERTSPALSQAAARQLANIVRNIEHDFGSPQDVEWAIDGQTIYITQTRPITTLGSKEQS